MAIELTDEERRTIERTAEAHRMLWELKDGSFVEVLSRDDMFLAGIAAGLERAAKVCDETAWSHKNAPQLGPEINSQYCAAAIRALCSKE